jgi:hypothetical protein
VEDRLGARIERQVEREGVVMTTSESVNCPRESVTCIEESEK